MFMWQQLGALASCRQQLQRREAHRCIWSVFEAVTHPEQQASTCQSFAQVSEVAPQPGAHQQLQQEHQQLQHEQWQHQWQQQQQPHIRLALPQHGWACSSSVAQPQRSPLFCGQQQPWSTWHHSVQHTRHWGSGGSIAHCSSSSTNANNSSSSTNSNTSSSSSIDSSSSSSSTTAQGSLLLRLLPTGAVPYAQLMRLDKPIGSWLLAWPGLWSIGLAAAPGHLPDLWLTTLFATGAVLMRGAGCTINDLWDRDIDKQVERTRSRPLAAGTVTPLAALVFLGAQLSASLAILLQLNTYTQVLGVASLSLVVTYPLMKRITWWPQAFLGLAMNYGTLMGYSAAAGACDWAVVAPLYAAGVSWTLIYDTIYAHQDKRDDALVGVKSTALLFGDKTKAVSAGFAVTQTLGLLLAGHAAGCGLPFFAAVAAGAGHVAWQVLSVDLNNGPDCMAKFVSNKWYGAIIYSGIVADRLLAV